MNQAGLNRYVHYSPKIKDYTFCEKNPEQCKYTAHYSVKENETLEEVSERIHTQQLGSAIGGGLKSRRKPDDYFGHTIDKWEIPLYVIPKLKESWFNRFPYEDNNQELIKERKQYTSGSRPPWHLLAEEYLEANRIHDNMIAFHKNNIAENKDRAEAEKRIASNLVKFINNEEELKENLLKAKRLPIKKRNFSYYYPGKELHQVVSNFHKKKSKYNEFKQAIDEINALDDSSILKYMLIGDKAQYSVYNDYMKAKEKYEEFLVEYEDIKEYAQEYFNNTENKVDSLVKQEQDYDEIKAQWKQIGWVFDDEIPNTNKAERILQGVN